MFDSMGMLAIQTLAMPADTNANGDIFGGWLVSQMDLAAGILAKKLSNGRVATVAIESMTFLKPVHVGDLVACYVNLVKQGRTSMHIHVDVFTESSVMGEKAKVAEGLFIFVAIDHNGQKRLVSTSS